MTDPYKACTSIFKAISDPTRLEIVMRLRDGDACAGELLENFSFSQPTLSYHMKILIESGLVTARKEGLRVRYTLNRNHLDCVLRFLFASTRRARSNDRSAQIQK